MDMQETGSEENPFYIEKKAIEFQKLFYPNAGKKTALAIRLSFAQGYRVAKNTTRIGATGQPAC